MEEGQNRPKRLVLFAEKADEDIISLTTTTSQMWGELQAQKYFDHLRETFELLAEFPKLGSPTAKNHSLFVHITKTRASIQSHGHRIFYRFNDHELIILRILHTGVLSTEDWHLDPPQN